jgi:hypothetical protein
MKVTGLEAATNSIPSEKVAPQQYRTNTLGTVDLNDMGPQKAEPKKKKKSKCC